MRGPRTSRASFSKAARIYLIATTVLTVGLLLSGVFSFRRQVLTIHGLSSSNVEIQGERVAFELERRVWQLAETCLRDPVTGLILFGSGGAKPYAQLRTSDSDLEALAERYPIASLFFAVRNGKATYLDPDARDGQKPAGREVLVGSLEKLLRSSGYYVPDRVYSQAIGNDKEVYQIFFVLSPDSSEVRFSGIVLDVHWIASVLLPQCSTYVTGTDNPARQVQMELRRHSPEERGQTSESELGVPFKTVLPSWELRLPLEPVNLSRMAVRRDIWFVALSVLVIASVLIVEVFLLFRVFPELHIIQARSEFISRVSHELRTPLTLIRLYAETLMEAGDLSEEERQNCLHVINRESDRLTRMINNVLEFSRTESRNKGRELTEGSLAEVISRTVDVYRQLLAREGFSIQLSFHGDLQPVTYDYEEVTQAVLNLLDNARKYSGDSRLIEVHVRGNNSYVVLEVADHGVGIPQEEKTDIFQAFYRARNARQNSGVGLGLYIVRNIMQAHGGKVEVESTPGKGSTFKLFFPVVKSAPRGAAARDGRLLAH